MDYKLPQRSEISNKSTYGRVLNIAGSDYMSGAAYLSSVSAIKSGCGYCFLASSEKVLNIVATKTSNIVFLPYEKILENLKNFDVVEIGCGLSTSEFATKLFENTINNLPKQTPIIIDADGLNILAKNKLKIDLENVILTPHPLEAARLLECPVEEILSDLKESAKKISKKYNCITVLKSHRTVISNRNCNIHINKTGNNSMAKAGSGDVLAGMISGLVAQNRSQLFEMTCLAVYLHGLCGDLAAEKLTQYCVMADDLIEFIPNAIKIIN